jgi:hypothetical protein
MIAISVDIEAQFGLNWPQWKRIVAEVEALMLEWLDMDDLDGLRAFAEQVLPRLKR